MGWEEDRAKKIANHTVSEALDIATVESEHIYRRMKWWTGVMSRERGGRQMRAALHGAIRVGVVAP